MIILCTQCTRECGAHHPCEQEHAGGGCSHVVVFAAKAHGEADAGPGMVVNTGGYSSQKQPGVSPNIPIIHQVLLSLGANIPRCIYHPSVGPFGPQRQPTPASRHGNVIRVRQCHDNMTSWCQTSPHDTQDQPTIIDRRTRRRRLGAGTGTNINIVIMPPVQVCAHTVMHTPA